MITDTITCSLHTHYFTQDIHNQSPTATVPYITPFSLQDSQQTLLRNPSMFSNLQKLRALNAKSSYRKLEWRIIFRYWFQLLILVVGAKSYYGR